jgi:hypothetical protein
MVIIYTTIKPNLGINLKKIKLVVADVIVFVFLKKLKGFCLLLVVWITSIF